MILVIAFIEALCLYALLIAILLIGKGSEADAHGNAAEPESVTTEISEH